MVKALVFKGEKKLKKRKRGDAEDESLREHDSTATPNAVAEQDDPTWTSAEAIEDITGPVIIITPMKPIMCLASDVNGKVYSSEIENLVEGDPSTAEPHDVRQVWVANRVAGTETITFKAHHGRYLGCDRVGILSATKEAVSPEESFAANVNLEYPGTFTLQTTRGKFVKSETLIDGTRTSLRGDAESADVSSSFRIRMQARFKPRLKASIQEKVREKISRKELQDALGRRLDDDEIKKLKRARRDGTYHEELLLMKVKSKHDKFA